MRRHLSDERLTEIALTGASGILEAAHLRTCAPCRGRCDRLSALLRDVTAIATGEADAAFPPERLTRQRARILKRVHQLPQAAPVAAFPSDRARRHTPRWVVAASAAAGVLLGVLVGQFTSDPTATTLPEPVAAADVLRPVPTMQTRPVPATIMSSDDELLLQIEAAGRRPRPATLRSLDALTPRASEIVSLR